MTDPHNGTPIAALIEGQDNTSANAKPNGAAQPQPQGLPGRVIVDHCKGILIVCARGMFSLLGQYKFESVLMCMAQAMGETIAEACWSNDVLHTITLRKKVAEAFEHGMKRTQSIAPAAPGMVQPVDSEQKPQ